MAELYLGLDGGGSATRFALCDAAGTLVRSGEVGAISGHLYDTADHARFAAVAEALAGAAEARPARVMAGITGLGAGTAQAAAAAALLARAFGIAPEAVAVEDDVWIAYHALFRPGEGHLVYCGTGSIGIHVRADGEVLRVGGRGHLIDDGGSAFWIAREALNRVWRTADVTGEPSGALAEALADAAGGAGWDATRIHAYAGGRSGIAALARAVAEAANAGDADALAVLRAAGRELARLAEALVARAGRRPVALVGRAAGLHPAIVEAMQDAGIVVERASPDAAAAAARMAARVAARMAASCGRGAVPTAVR